MRYFLSALWNFCFEILTSHGNFSFLSRLQQLLERVIVLIESRILDGDDEVEKCLETGFRAWRVALDLKIRERKFVNITSVDDVDKINTQLNLSM